MRTHLLAVTLVLAAACAPEPDAGSSAKPVDPPVSETAPPATVSADPRIPTIDPATVTATSSVADVMHAFVIPGSETLFAAESEEAPVDEAGWARLVKATQDVIHGCELLTQPGRSGGAAWDATCDTVIAATRQTADALSRKSIEDLVFTDGDMMGGCTSCHAQFRDQPRPEGHLVETPPT